MALADLTDKAWEQWGQENPYFGVRSHPTYLNANLNDEKLREFFAGGERHVEHVWKVIQSRVQPGFQPERVLDYGCGVGRLLIPFARRAPAVVGVDVSRGMLEQARRDCKKYGATGVSLLHVEELSSLAPGSFDLIHSFIVFQHIPVQRGEEILQRLIPLLKDGGVGAIHLTHSDPRSTLHRAFAGLRVRSGLVRGVSNVMMGRPFSRPSMLMNAYSMNRIFDMLIDLQCSNVQVEFSEHTKFRGAMLYFEKKPAQLL